MDSSELESLVLQYQRAPSDALFEQIAAGCSGIIRLVARQAEARTPTSVRAVFGYDDIKQLCLLHLLDAIRRFRPERGPFAALLKVVLIRRILRERHRHRILCVSIDRRLGWEPTGFFGNDTDNGNHLYEFASEHPSPDCELEEREALENLRKSLGDSLTAMEQRVVALFVQGYSYSEIGKQLRINSKAVDNAIWRVKSKIKGRIAPCPA